MEASNINWSISSEYIQESANDDCVPSHLVNNIIMALLTLSQLVIVLIVVAIIIHVICIILKTRGIEKREKIKHLENTNVKNRKKYRIIFIRIILIMAFVLSVCTQSMAFMFIAYIGLCMGICITSFYDGKNDIVKLRKRAKIEGIICIVLFVSFLLVMILKEINRYKMY